MTEPGRPIRATAALLWLVALAVIGALVYAPGLDIPYYSDDYYFVIPDPHAPWIERFTQRTEGAGWFRPLEAILLGEIQGRVGIDPRPVHRLVLGAHVLLAWMVWLAARRIGALPPAAELASVAFLVWQTNAMAVLSNDTLSQVLATAFGCAAALLLWVVPGEPFGRRPGERALSDALGVVAFAAALFTKEMGIAFLPILLLLVVWPRAGGRGTAGRIVLALALVATVGLYFQLRARAAGAEMPSVGEGRYQFRLGGNVAINAVKFALSIVLPTSTVGAFDALQARRWPALIGMGAAAAAFVAMVVVGVRRWGRSRTALAFLVLGAVALGPTLLLNHVSELYAYSALPFVAVVVGAGLAALLASRSGATSRAAVIVAIAALLLGHVTAVREKATLMEANGRRAEALIARVDPYVRNLAPGATLWLIRPPRPASSYSVFRLEGVELLRGGEDYLVRRANRPDARVRMVPEPGPWPAMRGPHDVTLRLEDRASAP